MSNKKKTLTRNEALENQQKENKKLLAQYMKDPKHKKPTNRRGFLEAGLISMSGWILGPTLAQLTGMLEAHAANCPAPNLNAGPAGFIHLHYSGGFQTLASCTPLTTGGQTLANYSALGLGTSPTFQSRF